MKHYSKTVNPYFYIPLRTTLFAVLCFKGRRTIAKPLTIDKDYL
jgi:hypothetical protein